MPIIHIRLIFFTNEYSWNNRRKTMCKFITVLQFYTQSGDRSHIIEPTICVYSTQETPLRICQPHWAANFAFYSMYWQLYAETAPIPRMTCVILYHIRFNYLYLLSLCFPSLADTHPSPCSFELCVIFTILCILHTTCHCRAIGFLVRSVFQKNTHKLNI